MRKVALLLCAVLMFSLCGCSFEFRSIEKLMRPPISAIQKELEKSISDMLGKNIYLRSPESGEHHSAITLHDIDGDKSKEAIVFYINSNDSSAVRMSVMKKTGKGWVLVSDFAGNGSGVYSIEFYDLNNDECDDMLVSWYLFEDKVNKTLTVYSCSRKGNEINFSACATEEYNLMHVVDVFGTGEKQIVLAYTDMAKSANRANIRLMRLNSENRVELINEARLDDRLISLSSMKSDKPQGLSVPRIFIDAYLADGRMVTEVLVWNKISKSFKPVIAADGQLPDEPTARSNNLACEDIDEDGLIEIPLRKPLDKNTSDDSTNGYMETWYTVDNTRLVPKIYYLINPVQNYRLFFRKEYVGRVLVRSNAKTGTWSFVTSSGKELFNISVFSLEDWSKNAQTSVKTLTVTSDKVYACIITEEGYRQGINENDLVEYFSLVN